jgi:hypothetical protein
MIEHTLPEGQSHRADRRENSSRAGDVGAAAARPGRASADAARDRDAGSTVPRAIRTLPAARQAFVAAIARDTPGADRPRLVKVLDALIAWSVAHSAVLTFRTDEKRADILSFELVGTATVFWSTHALRGASPTLEIHMPAGRSWSDEDRLAARETLNAHTRTVLGEGDRLRIGFGALKNEAARTAVLALMRQLLTNVDAPATSTATAT